MKKRRLKYISIKPFNNKVFFENRLFNLNNDYNVFFNFKSRLIKLGILIDTIDISSKLQIDKYVYCDVAYPWNPKLWLKTVVNKSKNILFCFESPLVNPFSQIKPLHWFFERVYTWNDDLIDNKKYFKFNIPQRNRNINTKIKKFKEKDFLVTVLSNKSVPVLFKLLSPYRKDLYRKRVQVIEFFEKTIPSKFSLYGKGWNRKKDFSLKDKLFGFKRLSSYKGEVKNKIDCLSKFKFCLSFENTIAPGYITEKLFDCFKAGCVPIYLGAPNVQNHIPKESFIDYREFDDDNDLLAFLTSIDEKKYGGYVKSAQNFLKKKTTLKTWFEKGFEEVFLEAVCSSK